MKGPAAFQWTTAFRRALSRGWLWAAVALTPLSAPAQANDQAARAAIRAVRNDSSYQTELTRQAVRESAPPPNWLTQLFNWLGGEGRWLVNGIAILLVVLVALAILYMTVPAVRHAIDNLRDRFRRRKTEAEADSDAGWRPDEGHARDLLASADRLASELRYAEAARLLLIRSVEEIATRRPGIVRPAYTARAIAALEDIPGLARAAFERVGQIVERGIWAERPLGEADWQEARAAYQDFAFGPHWKGVSAKGAPA